MYEHLFILMLAFGQSDLTTEQIRSQIQDAYWQNRTRYLCNVTIESVERTFNEEGNLVEREIRHQYKANHDSFLLISTQIVPQNPDTTASDRTYLGRNSVIYLIKPKNKEWIIAGQLPADEDQRLDICRSEKGLSLPIAEWELGNNRLLGLKDFTIQGMSRVTWNSREAIRVDTHRSVRKGFDTGMYFDPNSWVLLGSETKNSSGEGNMAVSLVEYDPTSGDPKRWTKAYRQRDGTSRLVDSTEITKFVHETHSDDEFSLAQFGLPEPDSRYTPRSFLAKSWWLVLPLILVVLVIVVRRATSRQISPTQSRM
ncbi:MAG: hypothetical protein ACJ8C4_15505 [Gemmataceae bacterium]